MDWEIGLCVLEEKLDTKITVYSVCTIASILNLGLLPLIYFLINKF